MRAPAAPPPARRGARGSATRPAEARRGRAAARARALALLVHQRLEAVLVGAKALLAQQLARQVDREAVGVVQFEQLVGADALVAALLGLPGQLLQADEAVVDRAPEGPFLLGRPHRDLLAPLDQL